MNDLRSDDFPPFNRYKYQDSYFGGKPPLQEGIGYSVVLGFGLFFSVLTTLLVFINRRFGTKAPMNSERFK